MQRKLNLFRHIKRHGSLEKEIYEGIIEGRRGRGRPKRRWSQDITDRMHMNVTEAGRLILEMSSVKNCPGKSGEICFRAGNDAIMRRSLWVFV